MLKAEKLTKTYGTVRAVDGISFEILPGEVFGLLGPNGAGKTTTIRMFTALTRPDSGACSIDGADVARDPARVKPLIGVVPQEINLDRELSAEQNLRIYGMLRRVPDLRRRVDEALALVGLYERRDSRMATFSGGMQRRLLLARALMAEPRVLFLDEPTIGLDPQIRRQIWDLIRGVSMDGRTVVLTTHYIEEAEALCDRVGIMARGRLLVCDTPGNLKRGIGGYVVEYVDGKGRLEQKLFATRRAAMAAARGHERGVTVRASSLEDVFVELTGGRLE